MTAQETEVLSTICGYQTINMLELMALTPEISDEEVVSTVASLAESKLVSASGVGEDQVVSITSRGYSALSSQGQLATIS